MEEILESFNYELFEMVTEYWSYKDTGLIPDGVIQKNARILSGRHNIPYTYSLEIVIKHILETATRRYYDNEVMYR